MKYELGIMKKLQVVMLIGGLWLVVGCQAPAEPEVTAEATMVAAEVAVEPTLMTEATVAPTATDVPATAAPPASPTSAVTVTPKPTLTATATLTPTATATPAGPTAVSYGGVSFTLPAAVMGGILGEVTIDESGRFGDVAFLLVAGEPCQSNMGRGAISVTSLAEEVPWYLEEPVQMITAALEEEAAAQGLPMWGANKIVESQVARVDFQNGSGFRSILVGAQDIYPVTNEVLLYQFYGLTDDGNYWVDVCFPINAAGLPADPLDETEGLELPFAPPDGSGEAQADYILSYNQAVQAYLDRLAEEAFTPLLSELDGMVETILVERE